MFGRQYQHNEITLTLHPSIPLKSELVIGQLQKAGEKPNSQGNWCYVVLESILLQWQGLAPDSPLEYYLSNRHMHEGMARHDFMLTCLDAESMLLVLSAYDATRLDVPVLEGDPSEKKEPILTT